MPLHRLLEALLVAALLFSPAFSTALRAEIAAPCPDGRDGVTGSNLTDYEITLSARAETCIDDAGFLAWHGAVLNRLGRYQAAADQLERALLLDPRRMGARIDYADALAATGQQIAARQLLKQVLQQPDIPPAVADTIAHSLERSYAWTGTGAVTVRAGHDSNLNRATNATSLALTLPGGEITLPLDEKSRARAGATQMIEVQAQSVRELEGNQHVFLYGEFRRRLSASASDLDYTQADLATLWRIPVNGHGNEGSVVLAAGSLSFGGIDVYRYRRLSLARDWDRMQTCLPSLGADVEQRAYPGNNVLDHRFLQLQSTWVCGSDYPLNLQLGIGREQGDPGRPGGNAWRLAARLAAVRPLGTGQIEAELRYGLRLDDATYSPLLSAGERLRLHSLTVRFEYRKNLTPALQAIASLETGAQHANLALFDLHNRAVHLGLRWQW